MHPKQAQLSHQATELADKLAAKAGTKKQQAASATMLWKYTDPDGNEFWLKTKKMTVKSPFTGKSFPAKPVRESPSGVAQDLREESKADMGAGPGGKTQNKRKKASDEWKVAAEELHCDMDKGCKADVTHIDNKGYTYCTKHGEQRKSSGTPCRKLKEPELQKLKDGHTIHYG